MICLVTAVKLEKQNAFAVVCSVSLCMQAFNSKKCSLFHAASYETFSLKIVQRYFQKVTGKTIIDPYMHYIVGNKV